VRGLQGVQCLAVVVACVTVVPSVLLCGCGGGGSSVPGVTSPRSDGQVALAPQTLKLVTDAGSVTSRTLSTPTVLASPGKEFLLPVSVSDLANVAGAAVRLEFDPAVFTCSDIELGKIWPSSMQTATNAAGKSGVAAVALAGTTEAPAGAGVIATFHLRVLPAAIAQNASLKVNAVLADAKGLTVGRSSPLPGGAVRPRATSTLIGDLMGTGNPEVGSAIKILRVVVKLDSAPPAADLWQWDCNKSGDIDVGDAIKILRCVVQLDSWPIPGGPGPGAVRIAFESNRDGNYEIYTMNADGSVVTRLTNNPATDLEPAWSPDGKKIAFASTRDGNTEIYVMNSDGSVVTRLTNNPAVDGSPAWSPDGKKIAFHSNRDGNYEIYVMNSDGAGVTRLTNNSADDEEPAWSPDGKRIAFRSDRDVSFLIYTMNSDGSGVTRLTNPSGVDASPAWSPDGKIIAFSGYRESPVAPGLYDVDIYTMNADGSGIPTPWTLDMALDEAPAWSPDGQKLAFDSDLDSGFVSLDICTMDADGSGRTRLTSNAADDRHPSYCPKP